MDWEPITSLECEELNELLDDVRDDIADSLVKLIEEISRRSYRAGISAGRG